jgi:hypothetical protein
MGYLVFYQPELSVAMKVLALLSPGFDIVTVMVSEIIGIIGEPLFLGLLLPGTLTFLPTTCFLSLSHSAVRPEVSPTMNTSFYQ